MNIYIGTSGFYYSDWIGIFYPKDLPKNKYLDFYMQYFNTIELNSTFYHLPKQKTILNWKNKAKEGFLYSLKAHRSITHYKKLKDVNEELSIYFQLIKPLKPHLGMILFQLPPSLKVNILLLKEFLSLLPNSYNYSIEFRDNSWYIDEIYDLLREYNITFCIHDFSKKETPIVITSKNVYIRFHGPNGRYKGSYKDEYLKKWADKIKEFLEKDLRVFCFFNNDFNGNAILDAKRLKEFLKIDT